MKELTVGLIASSKLIGAGMATVGVTGAGVGLGVLFGLFIASLGRNPFLEDKLLKYLFLGLALTEAMGLCLIGCYNYKLEYLKIFLLNISTLFYSLMNIIALIFYGFIIKFWFNFYLLYIYIYIYLNLLFWFYVSNAYLVKKEKIYFIKNNKNIKNKKVFKIVKRNYYKNNNLLGKVDNLNKGTLAESKHFMKHSIMFADNKKIKAKKFSGNEKATKLVESCKYYFAFVQQIEAMISKNLKYKNGVEIQTQHMLIVGENENNEGIYCNVKTPGKSLYTYHEHNGSTFKCKNDINSFMTVFEGLDKFVDKNYKFVKKTPVTEVPTDGSNIEARVLKSAGGSEDALKQKILEEGLFVDLGGKFSKFDN